MSQENPSGGASSPSLRLVLRVEGSRRTTVTLQVSDRVVVGRSDEDSEVKPGLDLGKFNGESNGVSRTHAAFVVQDHTICVEDLHSTNGTRLNGLELIPDEPYRLRDGDEIEFGQIRVTVTSTA